MSDQEWQDRQEKHVQDSSRWQDEANNGGGGQGCMLTIVLFITFGILGAALI
jgi:hypothetical protein